MTINHLLNNGEQTFPEFDRNKIAIEQPCGYRIDGSRIVINISAIANNRVETNTSGTLSIEFWALRQPYRGGDFEGVALAGTSIGEIQGQHFIGPCDYDLIFNEPPVGYWHLCLMVREWSEHGYQTQDAVNFNIPYVATWTPNVIEGSASKVINVDFSLGESANAHELEGFNADASEIKNPSDDKPPLSAAKVLENDATAKAEGQKNTAVPEQTIHQNDKPKSTKEKGVKADQGHKYSVSVNKSSVEKIAELKGLSKKVAQSIVENRPYKTLDELLEVKGVGKKLLDRIKPFVEL